MPVILLGTCLGADASCTSLLAPQYLSLPNVSYLRVAAGFRLTSLHPIILHLSWMMSAGRSDRCLSACMYVDDPQVYKFASVFERHTHGYEAMIVTGVVYSAYIKRAWSSFKLVRRDGLLGGV